MKYKIWMQADTGEQFCILAEGSFSVLNFTIAPRLAVSLGCTFAWLEQIQ